MIDINQMLFLTIRKEIWNYTRVSTCLYMTRISNQGHLDSPSNQEIWMCSLRLSLWLCWSAGTCYCDWM